MVEKRYANPEEEMEEGEFEEDVYSEEGREELLEEDEIDEVEEGFMEGYEEGEHQAKCAKCGKVLVGEDFVEMEVEGHHMRFCSDKCAESYEKDRPTVGLD